MTSGLRELRREWRLSGAGIGIRRIDLSAFALTWLPIAASIDRLVNRIG